MLEISPLTEDAIAVCLLDQFGIRSSGAEFLPIGNDSTAWVYCHRAEHSAGHFLKVKRGAPHLPSVNVPRYLHDLGVVEVVAPRPALDGQLWTTQGAYSLLLYAWIDGPTGMDGGLSDRQWREFGSVLDRIHRSKLPPALVR